MWRSAHWSAHDLVRMTKVSASLRERPHRANGRKIRRFRTLTASEPLTRDHLGTLDSAGREGDNPRDLGQPEMKRPSRPCQATVQAERGKSRPVRAVLPVVLTLLLVTIVTFSGHRTYPLTLASDQESRHHGSVHLPGSPPPELVSDVAQFPALLTLLGLALSGLWEIRRRCTKTAVLALVLIVGVFSLETAIHSVHPPSEQDTAAACAVLSASHHLAGASVDVPDVGAPAWTEYVSPVIDADSIPPLPLFHPHEGRAPPITPSA